MYVKRLTTSTAFFLLLYFCIPGSVPAQGSPSGRSGKQAAAPTYSIAIVPFYAPDKIWALYTPLITYLNKSTSRKWELKLYHTQDSLIDAFCRGEVSIVLFGPVPLGRVYKKCGAEPLLVALSGDGKPYYRSVIVTTDPSVRSIKDFQGKPFGVFKGSTVAHIVPVKMLRDEGLFGADIKPVFYTGQDSIVSALIKREISGAGIKEALFVRFKDAPLRELKTSGPLPNFAFIASLGLNPGVKKEFIAALSRLRPLTNKRDVALVKDWDDEIKNGFILPYDTFFQEVMQLYSLYEEIAHEAR